MVPGASLTECTLKHSNPAEYEVSILADRPGLHRAVFTHDSRGRPVLVLISPVTPVQIIVHPVFQLESGEVVRSTTLSVQTFLASNLGPISGWAPYLAQSREQGYNAVHLTPVQPLGESGSAYSLLDQAGVAASLGQQAELEEVLGREGRSLVLFTDLVLNHTATNTAWLPQHIEATYNTEHCPHLRPAYHLDHLLALFSKSLHGTIVQDKEEIAALLDRFFTEVVQPAKLWDYFVVDVEEALAEQAQHKAGASQSNQPGLPTLSPRELAAELGTFVYNDAGRWRHCQRLKPAAYLHYSPAGLRQAVEVWNLVQYELLTRRLATARDNLANTIYHER